VNHGEHIMQAEKLLQEAAQSPETDATERLVWVTAALAHATLAEARRSGLPELFG
jgi:predicted HD phosphohydrolase